MKGLTICQPYAHLIATGAKIIENRKWPTTYRGPLLIHAGKSEKFLYLDEENQRDVAHVPKSEMVFGAVVAWCELAECCHVREIKSGGWDDLFPGISKHLHAEGPFCFILRGVQRLTLPVPHTGALGLWRVREDLEETVLRQLRR